jgi:hypothetical protein
VRALANKRPVMALSLLIVVGGLVIFGMTTAFIAWGQSTGTPAAPAAQTDYNKVGSFGLTGYPALWVKPTAATPQFITDAFQNGRGVVLLAYVQGAADDDEMLLAFENIQATYADSADFFSFEAREVSETGDVLNQLGVNAPPILAVIRSDGGVYELYTGWISERVMEQVVANATRL